MLFGLPFWGFKYGIRPIIYISAWCCHSPLKTPLDCPPLYIIVRQPMPSTYGLMAARISITQSICRYRNTIVFRCWWNLLSSHSASTHARRAHGQQQQPYTQRPCIVYTLHISRHATVSCRSRYDRRVIYVNYALEAETTIYTTNLCSNRCCMSVIIWSVGILIAYRLTCVTSFYSGQ